MAASEVKPVEGELAERMNKMFMKYNSNGYVNVDGCILRQEYKRFADAIERFEIRDDDVWVCGFPKTGTTWTQEMVWCIANDLDFEERGKVSIEERFPLFEASCVKKEAEGMGAGVTPEMESPDCRGDSISSLRNSPSPRFIKSHFPPDLLPRELRTGEKRPKIVYVCRDPKDTCISYYHFSKLLMGFGGTLEEFSNLFLGDTVLYGSFWKNVLGFWNKRYDYDMLFLKYEDMKKDLTSVIKKTATFLGKNLTDDQVSLLTDHLSFSSMKENPAVNLEEMVSRAQNFLQIKHEGTFMRSGTIQQWKTVMNSEVIKRFDDWTREKSDGTGLSF